MAINSQGTSLHMEASCTKSATIRAVSRWTGESQTYCHDVKQEKKKSVISAKGILSFCFLVLLYLQPFCEKATLILQPLILLHVTRNKIRQNNLMTMMAFK